MSDKTIADRIIATPADASGALLHVGDEVWPKGSAHTFKIEYFVFDGETWHARTFNASWPCFDLYVVWLPMTDWTCADYVMLAPTDADSNLLHVGDKVQHDGLASTFNVEYFAFDGETWVAKTVAASWPCSDIHKVVAGETMSIPQTMVGPGWNGKPTMARCGSLRKANPAIPGDAR